MARSEGSGNHVSETSHHKDRPKRASSILDFIDPGTDLETFRANAPGTFIDPEAMKEKVRRNLLRPQYNVAEFYKDSGCAVRLVTNPLFEQFTLLVIGLNALWIAIDTNENHASVLLYSEPRFIIAENLFCTFFVFELTARFFCFRRKSDCVRDYWFVFDSFLVLLMVFETWVMTVITLTMNFDESALVDTALFRVARMMRLTRMARMARIIRALPELMIFIKGMVAAVRSVMFTLLLLMIITYVFAIAMTQLARGEESCELYFMHVRHAMATLVIHGTLLDSPGKVLAQLNQEPFYLPLCFYMFMLLAALTVMNMLIGVLCEVVSAVAATEREEMLVAYVNQRMKKVVMLLDEDGGGTISKAEFIKVIENGEACRFLKDIGVDVFGLVDLADFIFDEEMRKRQRIRDVARRSQPERLEAGEAGSEGETIAQEEEPSEYEEELTFEKFMDVVFQLRGTNNATVKDIVDLRKFVRSVAQETKAALEDMCGEIARLTDEGIGVAVAAALGQAATPQETVRGSAVGPRASVPVRSSGKHASGEPGRGSGNRGSQLAGSQPQLARPTSSAAVKAEQAVQTELNAEVLGKAASVQANSGPLGQKLAGAHQWEAPPVVKAGLHTEPTVERCGSEISTFSLRQPLRLPPPARSVSRERHADGSASPGKHQL